TIIPPSYSSIACRAVIAVIHPNFPPSDFLIVFGGVAECDSSETHKNEKGLSLEEDVTGVLWVERCPWGHGVFLVMLEVS
ncbi:hypothetical protein CRENBAI_010656, partial [Crenichthys baileyi]